MDSNLICASAINIVMMKNLLREAKAIQPSVLLLLVVEDDFACMHAHATHVHIAGFSLNWLISF